MGVVANILGIVVSFWQYLRLVVPLRTRASFYR